MSQNVLLISDDLNLYKSMKNILLYTGVNIFNEPDKIQPKIVIIDESKLNTWYNLYNIDNSELKIIVLCEKLLDKVQVNYNIIYYVIKPINPNLLCKRILEILTINRTNTEENILKSKKIISELLWDIGISPNLKGYNYMRDAIAIVAEDFTKIKGITKFLYPKIAETYKTKPANVERSIRNAIEVGWNKGRIDSIDKIFGNTVEVEKGKPTNSEFIAMLADYLRLKTKKI